jgi:hypothetical protein
MRKLDFLFYRGTLVLIRILFKGGRGSFLIVNNVTSPVLLQIFLANFNLVTQSLLFTLSTVNEST